MRTAEGLGVNKIYLTGFTPYPKSKSDDRLPHISTKIAKQISKTSLGAEHYITWQHSESVKKVIDKLKKEGFVIIGLEQSSKSIGVKDMKSPAKVALIVGREVEGIEDEILETCHSIVEIPMLGKKESFNVVQAAAMVLFYLRHISS